jgi:uncharacterized protein (TIGR02271 family)
MEDKKEHEDSRRKDDPKVIPVIEEKFRIDKEKVVTGNFRVSKTVHEEEVTENVPVTEENVSIKRIEINKYVDSAPPASRQEGDCTIISVVKEVLVVEKKLMLMEEIHVTKQHKESSVPVKDTLRREEVKISKTEGGIDFDNS